MDDVVDLDEAAGGPLAHVGRRKLRHVEAVEVALAQVERGAAVDDPLGYRAGDPGRVGHPDRLGGPETAQLARLPEQREAVGGEREDAVEAAVQPGVIEHRQQLGGGGPGLVEVVRGERHRGRVVTGQVGQVDRHRAVQVGADAEPVAVGPEIQVAVLVAQDCGRHFTHR
jgi:hypothetical protein